MTTPSSRMILDKFKIEVTLDLIHHAGKNGEHCYGENFIYECPIKKYIKSNQHMGILHAFSKSNQHMSTLHAFIKSNQRMGILHAFSNCVSATFNHGLSPSEVDLGDPKGEPTKHGSMLIEVDRGGKLRTNSVVDWGAHETHPNVHSITEVDWGGHDSSSNHMNEFLFS